MPVEIAAAATFFGVAFICVAGVGLVAYGIYKYKNRKENPYKENTQTQELMTLATVDDLVGNNPNLRHRNVGDSKTSVTDQGSQTKLNRDCNPPVGTQTDSVQTSLSDQDAQTTESLLNGANHFCCQDTQTTDSLLSGCNNLSANETVCSGSGNDDSSILSITSETSYPTWQEIPLEERKNYKCKACKKNIGTITYPCKHPYMCKGCAPVFFKMYHHRCPVCRARIKSYDAVHNE